jgi:hypothetical protein
LIKENVTESKVEEFQSNSPVDLKALLESLRALEDDLGNNPALFGERNREARRHAKAMIAEIQTELEKP